MEINFREITDTMDNLVRLYMVFGEEPFTFEEANSITDFSPTFVKFLRDQNWLSRTENTDEPTMWLITYNGARMTEIYIELSASKKKTEPQGHLF